ncbi:MAG: FecR domain-containing protein [Calditrichia bacterium]|nr:FecR domain-containing protein [Calditrichia bacterium]
MKQIRIKAFIILFAALTAFSFSPEQSSVGKVSFPLGNVLVLSKGETRFRKATFNMPVKNGDKVETKKQSRCEITYNDGSIIRIDERSIYTIEKATITDDKKEVESSLSIGKLWANLKKLIRGRDSWKLKSPAAVVAVRGTIYRMNAGADSSTQVLVYEGQVDVRPATFGAGQSGLGAAPGPPRQIQAPTQVAGPTQVSMRQWFEIIKAQQQIVVRPDGSYAKSDFNLQEDEKLDWVQWNKKRDAEMR